MNPVYTIMTPTKIPIGKINKSINEQFVKDCREHPNQDLEQINRSGLINPKFISKLDLHMVKSIQDKYIRPYLLDTLINLFVASTTYSPSKIDVIEKYNKNINIRELWLVEYNNESYFKAHTHVSLPNHYSFSWYLKCDDNRKVIFISENKEHEVIVSEGDILLFPGWLSHRAENSNSICCSGNFEINVSMR
tara:strand:- start:83 stop:658 length:576 start_codon:yes stop_codon:yes gene_type:complete